MYDYAKLEASLSTPLIATNRVLGWNGISGDYEFATGTISWGNSRQGSETWDTRASQKRFYGKVLLSARVTTADEYRINVKVLNEAGTQVNTPYEWYYRGGYKSDTLNLIIDLPKDCRVVLDWYCRAGYTKKSDMYFSLYANDRNVPIDVAPAPEVPPEVETKYKELIARLMVGGTNVTSAFQKFSYLGEVIRPEITIESNYRKNHINLWEYFYEKQGRRPNPGEKVHFVIPEDVTFLAPFKYTVAKRYMDVPTSNQFYKSFRYVDDRQVPGSAAVSLVGWDKTLGNDITVEVRGTILGSTNFYATQLTPYDKATGKLLSFNAEFKAKGFSNPIAAWYFIFQLCGGAELLNLTGFSTVSSVSLSNPVKMPAFESPVNCKLIIRPGAYVLGGGGNQAIGPIYARSDVGGGLDVINGVNIDSNNIQGGPAIRATEGAILRVENYGYLSGGGGGGNAVGSIAMGLMNNSAIFASGGAGAPLAGLGLFNGFPVYVDLNYIKSLPVIAAPVPIYVFDPSTLTNVSSANYIEPSYARFDAAVDWTRVGIDANGDNFPSLASLGAVKTNSRLLSPTAGRQSASANNYNVGTSGSGGAPGVNGQQYTLQAVGTPSLRDVKNVQGLKGQALVQLSGAQIINQNFPGSTYRA